MGLVHIYHGDGKGKTTSAMGLCCRAAGAGMRVLIYQFMKDGSGNERKMLEAFPNVTFANEEREIRFSFHMSRKQKEQEKERYRTEILQVFEMARRESYDVLLLDEILYAISLSLLEEELLTAFLDHKPEGLEVILTGQNPSERIKDRADYVSRIVKEKHPYDSGISAREGIER